MKRRYLSLVSVLLAVAMFLSCAAAEDEVGLGIKEDDLPPIEEVIDAQELEVFIDDSEAELPDALDGLLIDGVGLALDMAPLESQGNRLESTEANEIPGGLALRADDGDYSVPMALYCPDAIFASLNMDPLDFSNATGYQQQQWIWTSELVEDEYVDTWEVADESIVTVESNGRYSTSGIVTAHKPGSTTVKATTNRGRYGSLKVKVEALEALTIDDAHFPDAAFRNYLTKELFAGIVEKLNANVIPRKAAEALDEINFNWWSYPENVGPVKTLKGIEYFPALKYLDLDGKANMKELDLSKNPKLIKVFCEGCGLLNLNASNCTNLEILFCNRNNLQSLDVRQCQHLYSLDCSENRLTSLNISGCTSLRALYCDYNQLPSLNLGNNALLAFVECHHNPFASLSIAYCPTLIKCFQDGEIDYFVLFTGDDGVSFVIKTEGVDKTFSGEEWPYQRIYLIVDQKCSIVFDGVSHVIPPEPTAAPTAAPTVAPTAVPTAAPTAAPTSVPTSVKLNKTKATLYAGKTLTLKATVKPAAAKTTLTWKSSNEKVATVSDKGVVKALKKGKAEISVTTGNGLKAKCKITVKAAKGIAINKANFPDSKFRASVKKLFDADGDEVLSGSEIKAAKKMDIRNKGIKNLKGVGFFVNLELLYVDQNKLTKLDVGKNGKLKYLSCEDNKLTKLDVSKNSQLEQLNAMGNKLTKLDVSKNKKLTHLSCSGNKLGTLDVSKNVKLDWLMCNNNKMKKLTLGKTKKLKSLECYGNKLKTIDIGGCPLLKYLVNKTQAVNLDGVILWVGSGSKYGSMRVDDGTRLMDGKKQLF